jgi:predicted small lipoprotein YifL
MKALAWLLGGHYSASRLRQLICYVAPASGASPVTFDRRLAHFATIGALAGALALGACGRKGPLDPPPSASIAEPAQAAPQAAGPASLNPMATPAKKSTFEAFGPGGEPIAPKGQKKPIFLDWLID